jgi:type III secretory pathway component EscU
MEEKNLKGTIKKIKQNKNKIKVFHYLYEQQSTMLSSLLFSFLFVSGEKKVNNSYILLECVITLLGHEIESKREKLM